MGVNEVKSGGIAAVIVAGGRGVRLGTPLPKPLIPLGDRPLVSYSLETWNIYPDLSHLVLVCAAGWLNQAEEIARRWAPDKTCAVVVGGEERYDSVQAGLNALPDGTQIVAVHDAARPFLSAALIRRTLAPLVDHHGALPGLQPVDTLRKSEQGISAGASDRARYVLSQTPQCFRRPVLETAFERARRDGFTGTDDASYVERLPGARVAVVAGDPDNFKITTPNDLERAQAMVKGKMFPRYRCGEGFDAHRYATGRKLVLGGVAVPFDLGLHGHSDADVLCHALGDALLGAVSLGDLGMHFPDSDAAYRDISSIELLRRIGEMVAAQGFSIVNVDATLIVQLPKIGPYRDKMRANIAAALGIAEHAVSVKATTTEGMGPYGRGEGIACRAVALVVQNHPGIR